LRNRDDGANSADTAAGGNGSVLWHARNGDGSLQYDRGDWAWLGGVTPADWAIDDDACVGWDVRRADTLEVRGGGVDLGLAGAVGGEAVEDLGGEIWNWAEAGGVGVGGAVRGEPGVEALWQD